jgi:hypothetical protein
MVLSIHKIDVPFAEPAAVVLIALIFVHHHFIVRIVVFYRVSSSSHDERGSEFIRVGSGDAVHPRRKQIIYVVSSNLDMMIMTGTRRRRSRRVNRKMPEASAGCVGGWINPSSYDELGLEFVLLVGSSTPPASCTKKTADDIVLEDAVLLFSSCTMMMIIIIANPSRRRRRQCCCGNGRTIMEAGHAGVRIFAFVYDGRPFVN